LYREKYFEERHFLDFSEKMALFIILLPF